MPSEITRLLNQIDQEQQAMRLGLTGLASVARHDFIQAKQARIDACHSRLIELIGEKATELVDGVLESINYLYDCREARDAQLAYDKEQQERREHVTQETHQAVHRQPDDAAQVGDTLLYKLRSSQRPVDPEQVWHGKIKKIFTSTYNKRSYLVECLDFDIPGDEEVVYASQVVGYTPTQATRQQGVSQELDPLI